MSWLLPPDPTGRELADAIRHVALTRGVSVDVFAAPLSPLPRLWLRQLREAQRPRAATVARVRALLEGRPVPPPPASRVDAQRFARPARSTVRDAAVGLGVGPPMPVQMVRDREPCWRCGVRADLGCAHQPPSDLRRTG